MPPAGRPPDRRAAAMARAATAARKGRAARGRRRGSRWTIGIGRGRRSTPRNGSVPVGRRRTRRPDGAGGRVALTRATPRVRQGAVPIAGQAQLVLRPLGRSRGHTRGACRRRLVPPCPGISHGGSGVTRRSPERPQRGQRLLHVQRPPDAQRPPRCAAPRAADRARRARFRAGAQQPACPPPSPPVHAHSCMAQPPRRQDERPLSPEQSFRLPSLCNFWDMTPEYIPRAIRSAPVDGGEREHAAVCCLRTGIDCIGASTDVSQQRNLDRPEAAEARVPPLHRDDDGRTMSCEASNLENKAASRRRSRRGLRRGEAALADWAHPPQAESACPSEQTRSKPTWTSADFAAARSRFAFAAQTTALPRGAASAALQRGCGGADATNRAGRGWCAVAAAGACASGLWRASMTAAAAALAAAAAPPRRPDPYDPPTLPVTLSLLLSLACLLARSLAQVTERPGLWAGRTCGPDPTTPGRPATLAAQQSVWARRGVAWSTSMAPAAAPCGLRTGQRPRGAGGQQQQQQRQQQQQGRQERRLMETPHPSRQDSLSKAESREAKFTDENMELQKSCCAVLQNPKHHPTPQRRRSLRLKAELALSKYLHKAETRKAMSHSHIISGGTLHT
eukprot:350415-Chlamydomonas_euryale.AAC.12